VVLDETQEKLQVFLGSAQQLSLKRYALADKLATLVNELNAGQDGQGAQAEREGTLLEEMEKLQVELGRLEAGLAWVTVLERAMGLR
jgi:hypothetical protein